MGTPRSLWLRAARGALFATLLSLAMTSSAFAQGLADEVSGGSGGPPPWAYQMAHDFMSPFCPGRTLAACPSPQADQLRQWILFQAAAGQTQEQLEATLYERYGDVLLSAPRAEGAWGISAYAIPIGGFLLGGPLVAFTIYRLTRGQRGAGGESSAEGGPSDGTASRDGSSAAPDASLSDDDVERLVQEEFARS